MAHVTPCGNASCCGAGASPSLADSLRSCPGGPCHVEHQNHTLVYPRWKVVPAVGGPDGAVEAGVSVAAAGSAWCPLPLVKA